MKNEIIVELDKVSLHHGAVQVLRDVSLCLTNGVTLLYGANGAGKSSLLKLIAGLQANAKITGKGRVLNTPLVPRAASDRAKIGYMPQQGGLYDELSALENLQFRAAMLGLPHPQARCLEIIQTYDLTCIIKQRAEQLSGGWRQRLAFALTMLAQPQILLLDEPTAGVDLDAKERLWEQIDIEKARGTKIMISSHDPQEANRADQLIHLHRGAIEYSGAPTELAPHFNLGVALLARPIDASSLACLRLAINNALSPLYTDVTKDELRIVIRNSTDQIKQQQVLWEDNKEHQLRWTKPTLEDGLRAALLNSAQKNFNETGIL